MANTGDEATALRQAVQDYVEFIFDTGSTSKLSKSNANTILHADSGSTAQKDKDKECVGVDSPGSRDRRVSTPQAVEIPKDKCEMATQTKGVEQTSSIKAAFIGDASESGMRLREYQANVKEQTEGRPQNSTTIAPQRSTPTTSRTTTSTTSRKNHR